MEERLITFDTAKLAKEKGFDLEFCNVGWHGDFGDLKGDSYPFLGTYSFYKSMYCNNKDEHQIQRPTQSLLQRWLREIHNIEVNANVNFYNKKVKLGYYYTIDKFDENNIHDGKNYDDDQISIIGKEESNNTFEEALEIGLQEALKLIENKLD